MLRLRSALEAAGWVVWVDEDDIPPAAEWRDELAAGIRTAHTFVFVLSPDSVASEYCQWELAQAVSLGKRLIPVVIRPVDEPPEELAARQYVFMREQDDFDQSFKTLDTAIRTDLEWVREHRLWLLAALRWATQDRDRSLLLRGRDLKAAEAWLARQGERTEPRPTQLQTEFLLASRAWETRHVRIIAGAVMVALAVSSALGVVALLQRNDARNQAAIARSRELALSSTSQLSIDPERSLLLATEAVDAAPTAEADGALRRAVFSSRVRVAVTLQATQIGGLINAVAFSPTGNTSRRRSRTGRCPSSARRPGEEPEQACSRWRRSRPTIRARHSSPPPGTSRSPSVRTADSSQPSTRWDGFTYGGGRSPPSLSPPRFASAEPLRRIRLTSSRAWSANLIGPALSAFSETTSSLSQKPTARCSGGPGRPERNRCYGDGPKEPSSRPRFRRRHARRRSPIRPASTCSDDSEATHRTIARPRCLRPRCQRRWPDGRGCEWTRARRLAASPRGSPGRAPHTGHDSCGRGQPRRILRRGGRRGTCRSRMGSVAWWTCRGAGRIAGLRDRPRLQP